MSWDKQDHGTPETLSCCCGTPYWTTGSSGEQYYMMKKCLSMALDLGHCTETEGLRRLCPCGKEDR